MLRAGKAVVLVEVSCALAAILLVVDMAVLKSDLRGGLVPLAAALLALSAGAVMLIAGRATRGKSRRVARVAAVMAALGLTGIAAFFVGLAALSAMGSNLLSADTWLTALTSFVASLLVYVIVPLAVVALGVCMVRDHALPVMLRFMPWVLVGTVLGGGLLVAWAPEGPELWVELGWFVALAALVAWFAVQLTSHSRNLVNGPALA